ncbi:S-DNA-T family DNA segregation ATPase FtsK/SpoIIIE [Glycomyces algeriensis]|uniref:Cell division protein FtsK n=1 Tax=Glycomyces algeriensis TaxID=256037 RepID=A0A9W6G5K7_9ACTN|nr:cell division protein FtsK [Glycomyces algeriensis]MDR7348821.1 S-DNA-T family DNA segregation ATPase FtsK/SpoIIIE [Glycomyces algeriensis]GLI41524.1 cell division protein FtsK [Glycomyces algeriensis]
MTIENFDWQAREAELKANKAELEIETIEPADDDRADAGTVLVDNPAMHAAWDAPTAEGRAPILPAWMLSRTGLAAEAARFARLTAYRCGYHGVRVPLYGLRLASWAPVGTARAIGTVWRWASDQEGRPARSDAVAGHDWQAYQSLAKLRDRRVRFRGMVTATAGAGLVGAGLYLGLATPDPIAWGALGTTVAGLGLAGKPADKPLVTRAVVKAKLRPLTAPMVEKALSRIGIAALSAMSKGGENVHWVDPIIRDGAGWRAVLDLPAGTTAVEVIDRRDKLAAALARPLGCVWPEGQSDAHPGRLVLWVGDTDLADAKAVTWPLARSGTVDLFQPFPLGVDPRGMAVSGELMFTNWLVGSIPGMGKTFLVKLPVLAAGLDARAEVQVFELKGTGDLAFAEQYATRYASGADDDEIEAALIALRDLRNECKKRARIIKDLPRDICPENKVTPELASRKGLGLHPLVVAIDECQELFSHSEFGKEAAVLAEKIVKLGRALGVILILATQRPDKDSLPTGVSANVGTRACLRVMGQVENDMILGTSAYKNGIRATMFTKRDRGVFYLVGAADEPLIVKGAFVDGPKGDAIAARARALRIERGTLTGHAAGQTTTAAVVPAHNVLDDLHAVWPTGEANVWNSVLVDRLTELRPDAYGQWADLADTAKTEALTAAVKPYGLTTKGVGRRVDGEVINRRGLARTDLDTAREGRSGGR